MFERLHRNAASGALQFDPSSLLGLANVSPNLVTIAVDGTFVFANPAADGFLCAGRSGELVGRSALDWIHPEDRARALDRLAAREREISQVHLEELVPALRWLTEDPTLGGDTDLWRAYLRARAGAKTKERPKLELPVRTE